MSDAGEISEFLTKAWSGVGGPPTWRRVKERFPLLGEGISADLAELVRRTARERTAGDMYTMVAGDYLPFVVRILAGEELGRFDFPREP